MSNNAAENVSMEQVRDLLVGTQFKDMENRMIRQEERIMQEIDGLREAMKCRAESLENFMKSEAASLLHRLQEEKSERAAALKNEQRERMETAKEDRKERGDAMKQDRKDRDEALAKMTKEMAKLNDSLERKLAALSTAVDTVEQELRQLLLAESSRLATATEEKYKEAISALSRTSAQLQSDLVSRTTLSATFTEFAVRLAGDLSLAGEGSDPNNAVKTTNGESAKS